MPPRQGSFLCLLYFFVCIPAVSLSFCVSALSVLFPLRLFIPSVQAWIDQVICMGIRILMWLQPWYRCEFAVSPETARLLAEPGGKLFLSNHRSNLDAFIVLSHIPGIRILARQSLFHIPFLGLLMFVARQIPAKRGDLSSFMRAMNKIEARLRAGECVHVFPEMTRCVEGFQGTQDFVLTPFHVALQSGVPVIPVVFENTDRIWPKGSLRLRYRIPARVALLAPLSPSSFSKAEELRAEVKRQIDLALSRRDTQPQYDPAHLHRDTELQQSEDHRAGGPGLPGANSVSHPGH